MISLLTLARRSLRRLRARWLRLAPGSHISIRGPGHAISWADARLDRCRVRITGDYNRLEIGEGAQLWGATIELTGRHLVCQIGAHVRLRGGTFVVTDEGSHLKIGERTTMTGPVLVAQGGRGVVLGRDCMVAYGSDIRCSDGHSVLDAATGDYLNPAADVRLGDHVWVGIHSQILKGVSIDEHAIVAARSVVTRDVPAHALVAGNPARLIRTGVTWSRVRPTPLVKASAPLSVPA